jgi:hypothetical protein
MWEIAVFFNTPVPCVSHIKPAAGFGIMDASAVVAAAPSGMGFGETFGWQ